LDLVLWSVAFVAPCLVVHCLSLDPLVLGLVNSLLGLVVVLGKRMAVRGLNFQLCCSFVAAVGSLYLVVGCFRWTPVWVSYLVVGIVVELFLSSVGSRCCLVPLFALQVLCWELSVVVGWLSSVEC
jgi:hypothetical protein